MKSLFFEYQDKCIDYILEQKDAGKALKRMNQIYDMVTMKYGSGKSLMGGQLYERFMNAKWKLTYRCLTSPGERCIEDVVGEVYQD